MANAMISISAGDRPFVQMFGGSDACPGRFLNVSFGEVTLNFGGFDAENFVGAREFALAILTALASEGIPAIAAPAPEPVLEEMSF